VLSLVPRQRFSLFEQGENFGEAPKSACEARALPGKDTLLRETLWRNHDKRNPHAGKPNANSLTKTVTKQLIGSS
jgi:hypothetical protein